MKIENPFSTSTRPTIFIKKIQNIRNYLVLGIPDNSGKFTEFKRVYIDDEFVENEIYPPRELTSDEKCLYENGGTSLIKKV